VRSTSGDNCQAWTDRLATSFSRGLEAIVARLQAELVAHIFAAESTRSVQDRPDNPDAFDLLLRARSLLLKHDHPELLRKASDLYEQRCVWIRLRFQPCVSWPTS